MDGSLGPGRITTNAMMPMRSTVPPATFAIPSQVSHLRVSDAHKLINLSFVGSRRRPFWH